MGSANSFDSNLEQETSSPSFFFRPLMFQFCNFRECSTLSTNFETESAFPGSLVHPLLFSTPVMQKAAAAAPLLPLLRLLKALKGPLLGRSTFRPCVDLIQWPSQQMKWMILPHALEVITLLASWFQLLSLGFRDHGGAFSHSHSFSHHSKWLQLKIFQIN